MLRRVANVLCGVLFWDMAYLFLGYLRYFSRCLGASMAEKREGYRLAKEVFAVEGRGKFEDPWTFSYENEG